METVAFSTHCKTALITGASSGIGYELSKCFAAEGYQLVLVAREEHKLKLLAHELIGQYNRAVKTIAKDLSLASSPAEIFAELQQENIPLTALVNNAGFGLYGDFTETDFKLEEEMVQVNVLAALQMTKLFLRSLSGHSGQILNVVSLAAIKPGPRMAVYSATKSFLFSFSQSLAGELKKAGVSVTVFCPGVTDSEFQKHARGKTAPLVRSQIMDAEEVARAAFEGFKNQWLIVIPGVKNTLLSYVFRFLPMDWSLYLVTKCQELANKDDEEIVK